MTLAGTACSRTAYSYLIRGVAQVLRVVYTTGDTPTGSLARELLKRECPAGGTGDKDHRPGHKTPHRRNKMRIRIAVLAVAILGKDNLGVYVANT